MLDQLAESLLPDMSNRQVLITALCKAVREAKRHRWQPWPWVQRVTEGQERLDRLMREANMAKRGGGHPCVN